MPLGQMALPDNEVFLAPSVALALKWFRDVKSIPSSVEYFGCDTDKYEAAYYFVEKISKDGFFREKHRHTIKNKYNQYEEAESALLNEMLRLLKEK